MRKTGAIMLGMGEVSIVKSIVDSFFYNAGASIKKISRTARESVDVENFDKLDTETVIRFGD